MASLTWEEAETITVDNIVALINRAILENGNVFHSIRVSHLNEDGKLTQFLRPSDLERLEELGKQVRFWIQADIDEIRNPKKSRQAE